MVWLLCKIHIEFLFFNPGIETEANIPGFDRTRLLTKCGLVTRGHVLRASIDWKRRVPDAFNARVRKADELQLPVSKAR